MINRIPRAQRCAGAHATTLPSCTVRASAALAQSAPSGNLDPAGTSPRTSALSRYQDQDGGERDTSYGCRCPVRHVGPRMDERRSARFVPPAARAASRPPRKCRAVWAAGRLSQGVPEWAAGPCQKGCPRGRPAGSHNGRPRGRPAGSHKGCPSWRRSDKAGTEGRRGLRPGPFASRSPLRRAHLGQTGPPTPACVAPNEQNRATPAAKIAFPVTTLFRYSDRIGSVQVGASINTGIQLATQAKATISPRGAAIRDWANGHRAFRANVRLLHVTDGQVSSRFLVILTSPDTSPVMSNSPRLRPAPITPEGQADVA
jgi:hypothetical protein